MTLMHWLAGLSLLGSVVFSDPAQAKLPVIQERTPFPGSYVFSPNDGKRHPGIILLHGSEGGSLKNMWVHALLLTQSGFTTMTFCWWDCGRDVRSEPPPMLADIELKKTVDAMEWFRKTRHVKAGARLGLYGISKGAEQAMILASYQDQLPFKIGALVAHAPTDVVESGININWLDARCWICQAGVTDCSYQADRWNPSCGKIDGGFTPEDRDFLPMWRWNCTRLKLGARIELEKFVGPILITAGENDTDWSSNRDRVKRIETALKKAGRKPQIHVFPGEEHSFALEAEQKRKEIVDQFFARNLK